MHFPFFRSSFSGFSIFFPICSPFNLYFCFKLKRQNMKINVHSMLLLSLAALLSSCAAEGNDKKQDLIVKTTQAVPVSHQGDKEFSFIARPFRTSELSFRVGGPIDRFDVYAGNRYQQGSIIAEIDPRDFRIRKRTCRSNLPSGKSGIRTYTKVIRQRKCFCKYL